MKKFLALPFIFVSLSGLKTEMLLSTENPITQEVLKREPVPVPTQKQGQDVPVHSKPSWGETIKAMYNQYPTEFVLFVGFPIYLFIVDAYVREELLGGSMLVFGGTSTASFYYIYKNTKIPTQGVPSNVDSEQKRVDESK